MGDNAASVSFANSDLAATTAASRRRNRSNYRCSKCGQPKRGHVCPYQPRIVRAEGEHAPDTRTIGCQVEIDSRLVVRHLQLEKQGLPESYGDAPSPQRDQLPPSDADLGISVVTEPSLVPEPMAFSMTS